MCIDDEEYATPEVGHRVFLTLLPDDDERIALGRGILTAAASGVSPPVCEHHRCYANGGPAGGPPSGRNRQCADVGARRSCWKRRGI